MKIGRTTDTVEVGSLAQRILARGGGVAEVVANLVSTDKVVIGVCFIRLDKMVVGSGSRGERNKEGGLRYQWDMGTIWKPKGLRGTWPEQRPKRYLQLQMRQD